MGYVRHHAILATTWRDDVADALFVEAKRLGFKCARARSGINSLNNLVCFPDGSQEGYQESDEFEAKRDDFVDFLRSFEHDDGDSPIVWAEVQFGDDQGENKVTRDSEAWQREGD